MKPIHKCKRESFDQVNDINEELLVFLEKGYCFENISDAALQGLETSSTRTYLVLSLNECQQSEQNECMQAEERQNYFATFMLEVLVLNTKVDFDDLQNPIKTSPKYVDAVSINPDQ